MSDKTIGFFGDSFCASRFEHHSMYYRYETYISMLAKHYNAQVINLGIGGSSIYDTIFLQLDPLIKKDKLPDISVFIWTSPGRLFNRKIRNLNSSSVLDFKPGVFNYLKKDIWEAAKQYYLHLYDQEQVDFEYISVLSYIDNTLLKEISQKTKIVHLWSFANPRWLENNFRPRAITYPYRWKNGVEIRPALVSLSLYDNDVSILSRDHRTNHLDGQFKNETLFRWIRDAIDGYSHLYDYSMEIDKLFDKFPEGDPPAI